jgi:poly-gamma-glutamate synthesis protein (capsule biosynthesis protein)
MIEVNFIGDTCFSGVFSCPEEISKYNFDERIRNVFLKADYNVINLEGPITQAEGTKKKGSVLKTQPSFCSLLAEMNIKVFNLANNHIMDCGLEGLKDTYYYAALNEISKFGAGYNLDYAIQPVILHKNNISVALIGVSHNEGLLASNNSPGVLSEACNKKIKKQIRDLKNQHDWVVVNYHGGEEFSHIPMPSRRRSLLSYLKAGADLVIAHHAHVVQGFEKLENKYISYSLGNFVLDTLYQRAHEDTDESVILSIRFEKNRFFETPYYTKIKHKYKKVILIQENGYFQRLNKSNYTLSWFAECFRLSISKQKKNDGINTKNFDGNHNNIFKLKN